MDTTVIFSHSTARAAYLAALPHQAVEDPDQCQRILDTAVGKTATVRSILADNPEFHDTVRFARGQTPLARQRETREVEVLVSSEARRYASATVTFHCWNGHLPAGALWYLPTLSKPGTLRVYTVSPALHLVLRSRELDVAASALLAMELCGCYEWNPLEPGKLRRRREPLITVERLRRFVSHVEPHRHGINRAKRAADLAMDRSFSPRESALALFLTMGTRAGGMGFEKPALNRPVEVPFRHRTLLRHGEMRFDMAWPKARMAVEYDSEAFHSDERQQAIDKDRAVVARALGYTVLPVTTASVRSVQAMEPLVTSLSLVLKGRTPWPIGPATMEKRVKLRESLFRGRLVW